MSAIPEELKDLKQWTLCYMEDESPTKRPIGGPKKKHLQVRYADLDPLPGQYLGLCLTAEDQIIVLDVDNLPKNFSSEDLPMAVQSLLKNYPTYSEVSPSKKGLHVVYKTDKTRLAHRKSQDKGTLFEGSLFIRNQFITVTGNTFTDIQIANIAPQVLETLTLKPSAQGLTHRIVNTDSASVDLEELRIALMKLPATLSDATKDVQANIRRAYGEFTPPVTEVDDYTHWQYMASALHYGAALIGKANEASGLFIEWSATAETKYGGPEEAANKYFASPPADTGITHRTIFSLVRALSPQWEVLNKAGGPDLRILRNWEILMEFLGLTLVENEVAKTFHVRGTSEYIPNDVSSLKQLRSRVLMQAQNSHLRYSTPREANPFTEYWLTTAKKINPIKEWLDSYPEYNPEEGSYFQELWETLDIATKNPERRKMYKDYLKKNLMGVIKAHYYKGPYGQSTGIVIFQGPENSRKSTWIRLLLPKHLRDDYVIGSQASLSQSNFKDLQLEAGISTIWVKDEIEEFINSGSASKFKSFIVQENDYFRPLYGTRVEKVKRKCVFFGTTNEDKLRLADTGNRRFQIIPVEFCDTITQEKIDIGKVYAELLYEFNNTPEKQKPYLWVLTEDEVEYTNILNKGVKLSNETDAIVTSVWNFDAPFEEFPQTTKQEDKDKLWSQNSIVSKIFLYTRTNVKRTQLRRALSRLMDAWIDPKADLGLWTLDKNKQFVYKTGGRTSLSGYFMPPLVE